MFSEGPGGVVSLNMYWRVRPGEVRWEAAWDQAALAPPGLGVSFLSLSLSLSKGSVREYFLTVT